MKGMEKSMKNNLKRLLSLALVLVMVLSVVPAAAFAEETEGEPTEATIPELPTATGTVIDADGYTCAMSFSADEITDEQLEYYRGWTADFEMTVDKTVTFGGENYLGGQYDAWSSQWIKVPGEFTATAGQPVKIIDKIATLIQGGGTTVDFGYIYETVKTFNCGVYFTNETLEGGLNVTLALVMNGPNGEREVLATKTFSPEFEAPALPTASAAKVQNDDLTFAMKFTADAVTDEQLAYYGSWPADFVLTVDKTMTLNANGEKDGYLAGQYNAWSQNWVNVPASDVTLTAGQGLKIMQYATSNVAGYTGTTFSDVINTVKEFNCGLFVAPAFLRENGDVTATLKLVITNPKTNEDITIGEYSFTSEVPELPSATVKEISADGKTFAMQFTAGDLTEAQMNYFGGWYADYVLTVNKAMTLNANGSKDGKLSGSYAGWNNGNWVDLPTTDLALTAGQSVKIMQYNAANMGANTKLTYKDVVESVETFKCALTLTDDYLAANPGLEVNLELRLYNPADESDYYVIGETYTFKDVAVEVNGKEVTGSVADIVNNTQTGTVTLLKDASSNATVMVEDAVTMDLAGNAFNTTGRLTVFGNLIDSSADNSGLLVIDKNKLHLPKDNAQLPVYTGEGYKFFEIDNIRYAELENDVKFAFQPLFEEDAIEYLLKGSNLTGVVMKVCVTYDSTSDSSFSGGDANFTYKDNLIKSYLESYNPETGAYGNMFTLTLNGTENVTNIKFKVEIVSAGVTMSAGQY